MTPKLYRDPQNLREDYLVTSIEDYNAYYIIRGKVLNRTDMLFSKIEEPLIILKSDFDTWVELT